VALLGRVTEQGGFVARGSFFQRDFIRRQRTRGLPLHLIAHEDVIVLVRPGANALAAAATATTTTAAALTPGCEQIGRAGLSTAQSASVDARPGPDPHP
jgi:hypothetical protein